MSLKDRAPQDHVQIRTVSKRKVLTIYVTIQKRIKTISMAAAAYQEY